MAAPTAIESVSDVESFIKEYYDAWSGTDLDRIMSFYTEDVVLQIPGLLMEGSEAVRNQFARPFTTAFPGNRHFVKNMIFGPGVVTVEFSFEAEHKGPFAGHAATGARIRFPGCGVYHYDSATRQITTGRLYFDVGILMQTITDALIDDPQKSKDALRTNERNLSLITNVIPTFIHVLRSDGSVLYVNQAVLGYTGLTLEDVRKNDYHARVFHPDDVERLYEERRVALTRPVPFENEQRVLGKDGKYRWFLIRYNPLLDEHGGIDRWYVAAFDIDDRKRSEVELQTAFKQIEALRDKLATEKAYLEEEVRTELDFGDIVGENPALRSSLKHVATVAPTDSTVLVYGETGTGKELIARAVHDLSPRKARTFVKLNCAAIPTGLLESELFGHEKGAFTGAVAQKVGRFELAHQGTLFLDEVGDIPLELQPKLLRVLQEQEFERLGGTKTMRVNVRLVAATNRDLSRMVADRQFRGDLYYRLNVFPIAMPPLRQRADDIPRLVRHFTQLFSRRMGRRIEAISSEVMDALIRYPWPGNVRELQNVIERAVILSKGSTLIVSLADVQTAPATTSAANAPAPVPITLNDAEREHIVGALAATGWVVGGPKGAAARLGMKRSTLQKKMQKLGISRSV
jgi:PAS domain S-box-containing protein